MSFAHCEFELKPCPRDVSFSAIAMLEAWTFLYHLLVGAFGASSLGPLPPFSLGH